MRKIETTLYHYDELSEKAKEAARTDELWDINVDSREWWDQVYEIAKEFGVKITSFDRKKCNIEIVNSCLWTASKIHESEYGGELRELANSYLLERQRLESESDEPEFDDEIIGINDTFEDAIAEEFRNILSREYEYQTSKEAIEDTIRANEYEFLEDGTLYN